MVPLDCGVLLLVGGGHNITRMGWVSLTVTYLFLAPHIGASELRLCWRPVRHGATWRNPGYLDVVSSEEKS
jgi:hypothetical protein